MPEDHSKAVAMTPQQRRLAAGGLAAYRDLAAAGASYPFLVYYELCLLLAGNLPGLPGFAARRLLFPSLFKVCGSGPALGRGLVLRGTRQISIGRRLMLDDYAALDAHGAGCSITIGDCVSVGRFSSIAAKGGAVILHDGVNIGAHCRVATQSRIEIGESSLIAAYCYIGPGNHRPGGEGQRLIERDMEIKGGVTIGRYAWIGARATVLDGVRIGDGAIVGAHSLVLEDVPAGAVVAGIPARVLRKEDSKPQESG